MTTQDFHRIMKRPGWRKVASVAYNFHRDGKPTELGAAWKNDRVRIVAGNGRITRTEVTSESDLLRCLCSHEEVTE